MSLSSEIAELWLVHNYDMAVDVSRIGGGPALHNPARTSCQLQITDLIMLRGSKCVLNLEQEQEISSFPGL